MRRTAALAIILISCNLQLPGQNNVPNPAVTGPITGGDHGQAFGAIAAAQLERARYTQAEYFYGGTAKAYANDGAWGVDGAMEGKGHRGS